MLTLHGRSWRSGLGLGFVAGMTFLYPLLAWTGEFVGPIGSVPLSTLEAALVAVTVAAMTMILPGRGGYLAAAVVWVAGESLRAVIPFGGFSWAKVAFSQVDGPLAAFGGTPVVSLAVATMGCGIAWATRQLTRVCPVSRRLRRGTLVAGGRAVLVPAASAIAAGRLVDTAPEALTIGDAVFGRDGENR